MIEKPKKPKKIKTGEIRIRPNSINEEELYNDIVELSEVTKKLNKNKERADKIKDKLKKISLIEYLEEYKMCNENPGSIIIEAYGEKDKAEFMYVVGDKYINIKDEKDADELIKRYGKDVVIKDRRYILDPEMMEKYSEVISKMIIESTEIEETDKGSIFVAEEKYRVVGKTIDKLMEISDNTSEDIIDIFESIKPIESIRGQKIIKS